MSSAGRVYTLSQLANHIGAELRGSGDLEITGVANLENAGNGQLGFAVDKRFKKAVKASGASALILTAELAELTDLPALVMESPYLGFARASQLFDTTPDAPAGIHPSAVVHDSATISPTASVGANAVIEADASLADGAIVGPGCVVGPGCIVGENSRLFANVTLYHDITVGRDCLIHSGVVVGADGFGFAPGPDGWERIAQNGAVIIGDGVSIGANTTVDRGAIDDTVLERGVIIDNLCQIAHNVRIGEFTGIAGTTAIAGSATIGKRCTIAGGVGIVGHIELADGVHVSARTLVTKSLTEKGSWSGSAPMLPTRDWKKAAVRYGQLDKLAARVASLEKQLADKGKDQV